MNAQLRESVVEHPYIGGSNVAGILGVSPYKTPYAEYLNIIEGRPEATAEKQAFFKRRLALEPWAADLFTQKTGLRIVQKNIRYNDKEFDFIKAEIDFETNDDCNGEIKTVHPLAASHWGDSGGDACPVYVTAQAMHGLMVRPKARCYVHALVGFDDDRVYLIERDEATIAAMREKELTFWRRVQDRTAPDPINTDDILRMFLRDVGTPIEASDEIALTVAEMAALKKSGKKIENEIEVLKDRIACFMRENAVLTVEGKPILTWKSQDTERFDQTTFAEVHPQLFERFKKVSTTRVFRIK